MSRSNFNQVSNGNQNIHFSQAMFGEAESSRMIATPIHLTTFNAGSLVPIYCREILPDESIDFSVDAVIRQTTLLTPTMGNMTVDFYAYFVPNRIVNQSWKAVQGENFSGSWTANSVSLAPLSDTAVGSRSIPVGSVADYYGFPTQSSIPNSVLAACNDLKFRGYVMIWNEWFRDQNYQPPIPISYLNVYQGFLDSSTEGTSEVTINSGTVSDGSVGPGAISEALYGSGHLNDRFSSAQIPGFSSGTSSFGNNPINPRFRATQPPLKVNKMHDYFTSVLPSPQKSSSSIFAPVTGSVTIPSTRVTTTSSNYITGSQPGLQFRLSSNGSLPISGDLSLRDTGSVYVASSVPSGTVSGDIFPINLATFQNTADVTGLALSVDDIRMASAIQQVYEILARGGSRYREIVSSFFGIEVDDPFGDIPKCLGHIRRDLDLYQTAQTSASVSGNTPQGNLSAFGYTSINGHLFSQRFIEHGYVHVFAIVRHRNIYPSFMARDNFRLNMLDFYTPPLANISEQPVFAREINPFSANANDAFGYQEAWAEYRYEPDYVSGYMRPGIDNSLALWNYADDFDSGLVIANGNWLLSNSQAVLDRTLAVTSSVAPQFKGQFRFVVDKTLPMPTYSVPGMDII